MTMRLCFDGHSPFTERASRSLADTIAAERRKREEKPTMPDEERIDCPHCGRRKGAGATREPARDYPGQVIIWQGELVREVAFRDGACAAVRFECQTRETVGGAWTVTWRDYVEDWKAERVIDALRGLRP
jgi:hypothetical protein